MLGHVLPGLRELRAPLAGGYLWLVLAWMVWGDKLPSKGAEKADPVDRLYGLEPVISNIGLAVVASVAAYIVGSIAIDVQTGLGRRIADLLDALVDAFRVRYSLEPARWQQQGRLSLTAAGNSMLEQWEHARAAELREVLSEKQGEAEAAARHMALEQLQRRLGMESTEVRPRANIERQDHEMTDIEREDHEMGFLGALADALSLRGGLDGRPPEEIQRAAREYIVSNRDLLKTRLLDLSQPLHSELDRPDAEATFRMALWPPLAVLVFYLAVKVSWWWGFAIVVPVLLTWQWISLRRQANTALVAAFVTRDELSGEVAKTEVRKGAVDNIDSHLRLKGYESPEYLLEYAKKPVGAPPPTSPPSTLEQRVPGDPGARASDGQSRDANDPGEPEEQQEPKKQGEPTEQPPG